MNEIILFILLIALFLILFFTNKYLEKTGLMVVFITTNILNFIMSFKYITISTLNFCSNSIVYITMFMSLCLLLEKTSKSEIKKLIYSNLLINIAAALMLYIMSYYTQSLTDTVSINMTNVFLKNYNILFIFPIVTFISQNILFLVYRKIKNIYDNIFITNTTSYLLVGLIDVILLTFFSYYKVLDTKLIIKILLSTYMIRLIILVIYSSILTILKDKKVIKWQI